MLNDILTIADGEVIVSELGKGLSAIKNAYNTDRNVEKKTFKALIKYLFFMYSRNTPLDEMGPIERERYVLKNILEEKFDLERCLKKEAYFELYDFYKKINIISIKRSHEAVKRDIENTIQHLENIPYSRNVVLKNQKVTVEIDGQKREIFINVTVPFDNSDEKMKTYKSIEILYDLEDKLRKKLLTQINSDENDVRTMIEKFQK